MWQKESLEHPEELFCVCVFKWCLLACIEVHESKSAGKCDNSLPRHLDQLSKLDYLEEGIESGSAVMMHTYIQYIHTGGHMMR